ncbi:MAG: phosphoribosylglycinamide formyltransferase [Actinobacteria bacterium]|nr:phosphoribosylglycinamide formyltransferase [Actinomycetota bacterium]
MRLAVLISGSGTNLQALLDAIDADPDFGGEVVVVGSDKRDAYGLERARQRGIATVAVDLADHPDRPTWEKSLVAALQEHQPEAVVLAGFMKLVSGEFLGTWPGRVVNTHPSLLPAFRGAHAVRDALDYGVKVTGCTVHLVDEQVDHGPIIGQRAVEIREDDTEGSLHERVKAVEHELLPRCVKLLCHGRLRVEGRHVHITEESTS